MSFLFFIFYFFGSGNLTWRAKICADDLLKHPAEAKKAWLRDMVQASEFGERIFWSIDYSGSSKCHFFLFRTEKEVSENLGLASHCFHYSHD